MRGLEAEGLSGQSAKGWRWWSAENATGQESEGLRSWRAKWLRGWRAGGLRMAALLLAAAAAAPAAASQGPGTLCLGPKHHFQGAQEFCESHNMELAMPKSLELGSRVVQECYQRWCWLGLYKPSGEGSWIWLDGEALGRANWDPETKIYDGKRERHVALGHSYWKDVDKRWDCPHALCFSDENMTACPFVGHDEVCMALDGHEEECEGFPFLTGAAWLGLGILFILVIGVCLCKIFLIYSNPKSEDLSASAMQRSLETGPLDAQSMAPSIRATEKIEIGWTDVFPHQKWVTRASWAAVACAIWMIVLGLLIVFRGSELAEVPLLVDGFVAILGACCKFVVAHCAFVVHRHLSQTSKDILGPWIALLAGSKLLMGVCTLMLSLGYFVMANDGNHCVGMNIYFLAVWLSVAFQTAAGVALLQVHLQAVRKLTNHSIFTSVVGWWWISLLVGTFAVAACFWLIGAVLTLFTSEEKFPLVTTFFVLASVSQILVGVSLLRIGAILKQQRNTLAVGEVQLPKQPLAQSMVQVTEYLGV